MEDSDVAHKDVKMFCNPKRFRHSHYVVHTQYYVVSKGIVLSTTRQ